MQQGVLWFLLSFVSIFSSLVFAEEMEPNTRQMWVTDELVNKKVEEFKDHAKRGDVDSIKSAMNGLSLPQQEAVRFLLLQKIEKENILITQPMASYIKTLSLIPPAYQSRHIGEGYEFTTPAFAYPSIANRILRKWQYEQKILNFVLAVERRELNLEHWLNEGTPTENQLREKLLVEEMDGLSPPAIEFLVEQVVQADNKIIFWLPSTSVMVRLARESADARVYKMLWRMRTDKNSQQELFRLMENVDIGSLAFIMDASANPSLNGEVVKFLTSLKPLPNDVKAFLIESLSTKEKEQALFVAEELSKQGYNRWLQQLVNTNKKVNSKAIKQVISN